MVLVVRSHFVVMVHVIDSTELVTVEIGVILALVVSAVNG